MPSLAKIPGGYQVRFKTPGWSSIHFTSFPESVVEFSMPIWRWRKWYFRVRSRATMRRVPPGSWRWKSEISHWRPYPDPGPAPRRATA